MLCMRRALGLLATGVNLGGSGGARSEPSSCLTGGQSNVDNDVRIVPLRGGRGGGESPIADVCELGAGVGCGYWGWRGWLGGNGC